jgi:hypothetical protein
MYHIFFSILDYTPAKYPVLTISPKIKDKYNAS